MSEYDPNHDCAGEKAHRAYACKKKNMTACPKDHFPKKLARIHIDWHFDSEKVCDVYIMDSICATHSHY